MEDNVLKIKEKCKEILSLMGYDDEPIIALRDGSYIVNCNIDEPELIIGRHGEVLDALQHLLRVMLKKIDLMDEYNVVIDVNGYRARKNVMLEKRIRDIAFKVRSTGRSEELPPMNSYERKIVHSMITKIADLESVSIDTGINRRVVVKKKTE